VNQPTNQPTNQPNPPPPAFKPNPLPPHKKQVHLPDSNPRAFVYVSGRTPNRWGFVEGGKKLVDYLASVAPEVRTSVRVPVVGVFGMVLWVVVFGMCLLRSWCCGWGGVVTPRTYVWRQLLFLVFWVPLALCLCGWRWLYLETHRPSHHHHHHHHHQQQQQQHHHHHHHQ
jgi:hypothetical protein